MYQNQCAISQCYVVLQCMNPVNGLEQQNKSLKITSTFQNVDVLGGGQKKIPNLKWFGILLFKRSLF